MSEEQQAQFKLHSQQQKLKMQQQQQQQQQQQPEPGQQVQASKCGKESTPPPGAGSNATPHMSNIHEMRNQDYINRLMAATPPYLYSAPAGHNFFFSDMLRALVQARQNENVRQLQLQQQHQHQHQQQQQQHHHHQQQQQQQAMLARRPRKRLWSQHRPYYDHLRERKETEEKQLPASTAVSALGVEKPLELTNKAYFQLANAYQRKVQQETMKDHNNAKNLTALSTKCDTECEQTQDNVVKGLPVEEPTELTSPSANSQSVVGVVTPPAASLPPQDLVLPPPPPVWYPPVYPPYAFDPLHFFIDLRVSGHIYDRKKENVSPLSNSTDNKNSNGSNGLSAADSESVGRGETTTLGLPNKHRHGSAFTVPTPRSSELKNTPAHADALNLSAAANNSSLSSKLENYAKYYDLAEAKENNHPFMKHGASYMLQQLPRLYSQFAARDLLHNSHAATAASIAGGEQNFVSDCDGSSASNNNDNLSSAADNKSDCDSDGHGSVDNSVDNVSNRDIDVEIIDSIKYRTDAESSHCSTPDDASITQID